MPYRRRRSGTSTNRNRRHVETEKVAMLRMRYLIVFKYNIRQILQESSMDEEPRNAFIANVIAKGSRISLVDAKEYVRDLSEQGVFDSDISDRICILLDRNRKYR